MAANLKTTWVDSGLLPKNPANPAFPMGIDLDMSKGMKFCQTALKYPAPRIGYWVIECVTCGFKGIVTTAGRADDPRSVKVPCKPN